MSLKRKRIFAIIATVAMLLAMVPATALAVADSPAPTLEVEPTKVAGEDATYTVQFTLESDLGSGDGFGMELRDEVSYLLDAFAGVEPADVRVYSEGTLLSKAAGGSYMLEIGNATPESWLKFTVTDAGVEKFNPGYEITVVVDMTNPTAVGDYLIRIYTNVAGSWLSGKNTNEITIVSAAAEEETGTVTRISARDIFQGDDVVLLISGVEDIYGNDLDGEYSVEVPFFDVDRNAKFVDGGTAEAFIFQAGEVTDLDDFRVYVGGEFQDTFEVSVTAIPLEDIVDTAIAADDFNTLVAAVVEADLVDALRGPGPFTVFAPTDAAFEDLADALGVGVADLLDLDNLADILLYHVVGAEVFEGDLSDGQVVTTLLGETVTITIDNGDVFVNDAQVIIADIECTNGVIHAIDAVLLPPEEPEPDPVPYTRAGSFILDYDEEVEVNEDSEFTVRFRDAAGRIDGWVEFYVHSSRDAETVDVVEDYEQAIYIDQVPGTNNYWRVLAWADNGDVEFGVSSSAPGNVTITLYQGYDDVEEEGTGRFDQATFSVVVSDEYEVTKFAADKTAVQAGASYKLEVEVVDDSNWEAAGVDVEFFERKEGRRWTSLGTKTTDRDGEVSMTVRHDDAAEYDYYIKFDGDEYKDGDERVIVTVEVFAAAPFSIKADKDSYWFEEGERTVKFIVEDRYGNKLHEDSPFAEDSDVVATVTDPDGDDEDVAAGDITRDKDKYAVTYDFDEEGTWEVEAFIAGTGISATTVVNIDEFGDVAKIELDADRTVLKDGLTPADTAQLEVTLTDENGIEKEIDPADFEDEDIVFSSSAPSVATVNREGVVTARDTGTTTITAFHLDSGLEDSLEFTVSGEPVSMEVVWDYEPGELEGEVTLIYYDEDGLKALEDFDSAGYRVFTPAGVEAYDREDFEDGEATFMLEADAYGTYTIRVVTDLGISATFSAAFMPPFDMGAEQVIMYIGSTTYLIDGEPAVMDVAPFIEEDRTFVPVRFLAEAFAAEADWGPKDALTEWVSLTREDVTIMIMIGGTEMTVTRGDEVEVVELDAPARIVDGRTFLPFRAIGEAFGAEVDFETDEETGLTTSVWFTQEW